jgi:integrase
MGRMVNRLTAVTVTKLNAPGFYFDGDGLLLKIAQGRLGPTKSWVFRYRFNGKRRDMGLGPLRTFTLAEAREQARLLRQQVMRNIDPLSARDSERAQRQREKAVTFRICAEQYIASHKSSWKNAKHIAQWTSTLATYVYPVIGDLPAQDIETDHILNVLQPIWSAKPETAARVRGRIEVILDWAKVRNFRSGENPARWRGHIEILLPARSKVRNVKHHSALPFAELPNFVQRLQKEPGIGARALEYLILTAARTSEVLEAAPEEIKDAVWIVPPDRMKAHKEHRVPLCERAQELATAAKKSSDGRFLFAGRKKNRPMSNMAMLQLLKRMGYLDLTAHGFRSTFKDWAAECTTYSAEVSEMALAHTIDNKVEAAYRRGDLFIKRAALMNDWACFCAGKTKMGETTCADSRQKAA